MGQRHQCYVFVKDEQGKVHGTGIHHQWLYGHTAGLQTVRMMEYQAKAAKTSYHPFVSLYCGQLSYTTECLRSMYSLILEEGYFHNTGYLGEKAQDEWERDCVRDPRNGDNNDGITVFDFTDKENPTYCMMNIQKQNLEYEGSVHVLLSKEPVSVEQYMRAYYPLGGSKYQKENWKPKNFAQNERHLAKIVKRAKKFKVTTKERMKELMPALYKPSRAERDKALANAAASVGAVVLTK